MGLCGIGLRARDLSNSPQRGAQEATCIFLTLCSRVPTPLLQSVLLFTAFLQWLSVLVHPLAETKLCEDGRRALHVRGVLHGLGAVSRALFGKRR